MGCAHFAAVIGPLAALEPERVQVVIVPAVRVANGVTKIVEGLIRARRNGYA
jgi:hypothetical protein